MRLINEILLRLGFDENLVFDGVCYTVLDGHSAYFQNIKSINKFTPTEIELGAKKGIVRVSGSGLYVSKYSQGDLIICGKIKEVERVD